MKPIVLLLLAAIVSCVLANEEAVDEIVAIVKIPKPEDVVSIIKRGISLDHPSKSKQTFEAYLTAEDVKILDEYNLEYEIQPPHSERTKRADTVNYHDYVALTNFMKSIADQYPEITTLFSIGKSVQSRELWGIRISDNPTVDEQEPKFKYIANMHGDEVVGREMMVYLIELLVSQYKVNDRLTKLVDNTDIYIIPTMNPDGFERKTRANANNVDLNRNFPDQFSDPVNTKAGRQVEVQAVMDFVQQHNFVLSANFHGGAVVANYAYDGNANYQSGVYSATPDDAVFKQLALTYSNKHTTMHKSFEFRNGITNGAEWYVLYGGMQDWNYVYNQGVFEITLEISENKWPSQTELAAFWDENREALLSYMELIHTMGVRGTVKDANGRALAANITVSGNTRTIKTNPAHGDYYRILMPGTYTISAAATGFTAASKPVTIVDGSQQVLDFVLTQ